MLDGRARWHGRSRQRQHLTAISLLQRHRARLDGVEQPPRMNFALAQPNELLIPWIQEDRDGIALAQTGEPRRGAVVQQLFTRRLTVSSATRC